MIALHSDDLGLTCDESGHGLTLIDARRGARWVLDERSLVWGSNTDLSLRQPLVPVSAVAADLQTFSVTYAAGDQSLQVSYEVHKKHVEIRLSPPAFGDVRFATLPGSFLPDGDYPRWLLPIMQGMLWDGRGEPFDLIRAEGSHFGFSMAFVGALSERGGLLVTAESSDDLRWWLGKDSSGRTWATPLQIDSLGKLRYERVARVYVTHPDIVAVAKTYRARVQEHGRFVSWEDKLLERPGLDKLFGALMAFTGYCQDDLDYAAECAKLKAYGFDRALVYPVRFNAFNPEIVMGGRPAIDLDTAQVAAVRALGYDVAPWSWLNEAMDDGSDRIRGSFRRTEQGQALGGWAIDAQRWHPVCTSFVPDHQVRALGGPVDEMTWDHFDVLSCAPISECYGLDHPHHQGGPLARSEDRAAIRRTFLTDQAAGLAVSSENFNDAYSLEYDIGSVKAWPQYGPWPFWPIPLTMLVYHDSLIHSWWEVHNYNSPWFSRTRSTAPFFEYGGGRPRLDGFPRRPDGLPA